MRFPLVLLAILSAAIVHADPLVGPSDDGGVVVPTRQLLHPAGKSIEFHGRPVDLVLSPDGKTVYVKSDLSLFVLDVASGKVRQELKYPPKIGASLHGMALTHDGSALFVTLAQSLIAEVKIIDGTASITRTFPVRVKKEGESYPCGIALSSDEKTAYVCLSCNNCVAIVDLSSTKVMANIPVGIAPFDIELSRDETRAYVSNWGGRRATTKDMTSVSAGTPVVVDKRGIACTGTVSVIDLRNRSELAQIETGLHPSDLLLDHEGNRLFVANANSDTVDVIDVKSNRIIRSI